MITMLGRGNALTIEQVRKLPYKPPADAGDYFQGIPHGTLVDTIEAEIAKRNWTVGERRFCTDNGGANLAGSWTVTIPGQAPPDGVQFAVGVVTSNDRHRRLRLVTGANVVVCNNGLATGEILMVKKHTTGFNLAACVTDAFEQYLGHAAGLGGFIAKLKAKRLTRPTYEHCLLQAGRAGIMPWSRLGKVDGHYYQTPEKYREAWGQGTAWTLLNAFTAVVKRNPALTQMYQMNKFREIIEDAHAMAV